MSKTILVVEDEPGIRLSIKDELESEGFTVHEAENGEEGLEMVQRMSPDLIILDIMMPVLSGTEVCKSLRMSGDTTPILMLTVKDKEIDKVLGLELGADDYMTKPFSLRELLARIRALLRRTDDRSKEVQQVRIGDVVLNFKKFEARKNDEMLEFTPLEYQLLQYLVRERGAVLSRNEILDHIWGEDNVVVTSRTIDSHIANIRKKIENDPADPQWILSVHGIGYKLAE
jgi:two-component system alkaline phosphatase synthesis response regulator PhoP